MALQPVNKRYTASGKGLVTEGNELSVLENTNRAETNYELLHDGSRRRRRPILEETADRSSYLSSPVDTAVSAYLWRTPARVEQRSILVEEVNGDIRFYWVEHDNLDHMRSDQLPGVLRLPLWGRTQETEDGMFDYSTASSYTEGNGSLYVFNQNTGTIKVDYHVSDDVPNGELRFTPIGTWTRDYENADENLDPYFRQLTGSGLVPQQTDFNGEPFLPDLRTEWGDTLDHNRAYNLTNAGWPEEDIANFVEQSVQPVQRGGLFGNAFPPIPSAEATYPAFMDRYLDGRVITEAGGNQFSWAQLKLAQQRRSEPPMGARVGDSAYHPAGSLSPIPVDVTPEASFVLLGGFITGTVEFDTPFVHSKGREAHHLAAFVHYMVVELTETATGETFDVGIQGVFDADYGPNDTDGTVMQFNVRNAEFAAYDAGTVNVKALWMYPSPTYAPHKLDETQDRTSTYDYRKDRRPRTGAFYAGRLWQFGDEHNRAYYSQLIHESTSGRGKYDIQRESMAYTANAPTDADDNSIVATDGGYILISDSGTHLCATPYLGSLLLGTDHGIWEIRGGKRDGTFTADDFSVRLLVKAEVLSHRSMVVAGAEVHVATDEGVVRIFPNERTGVLESAPMSRSLIKTEYDEIIRDDRDVLGAYDSDTNTVRWVFPRRGRYTESDAPCPMLTYHMEHDAWYRYDTGFGGAIGEMIVLPYTVENPTYNRYRYLCVTINLTGIPSTRICEWGIEAEFGPTGPNEWVEFHDPINRFSDFMDVFQDPNPERTAPPAFMETNHILLGDGQRWNHLNYVTVFNRNVSTNWVGRDLNEGVYGSYDPNVPGSTLLSARWDWSDQEIFGKFTHPQETYRHRRSYFPSGNNDNPANERGEALLVSKQKVRGRGREFRLRYDAFEHHDSHIVGWAFEGLVNTTI